MDKKEFVVIATVLKQAYGEDRILPNQEAMDVWFGFLKDFDCRVMQLAVSEHIATNKYPPAISELRELAAGVMTAAPLPWDAAWGTVLRAVRKFGQYQEIEALQSLDEATRTIISRMGFQNICLADKIEVERANFRMAYENEAKFRQHQNMLSRTMKNEKQTLLQTHLAKLADRLAWKGGRLNDGKKEGITDNSSAGRIKP